jgi:hypothetical protein
VDCYTLKGALSFYLKTRGLLPTFLKEFKHRNISTVKCLRLRLKECREIFKYFLYLPEVLVIGKFWSEKYKSPYFINTTSICYSNWKCLWWNICNDDHIYINSVNLFKLLTRSRMFVKKCCLQGLTKHSKVKKEKTIATIYKGRKHMKICTIIIMLVVSKTMTITQPKSNSPLLHIL